MSRVGSITVTTVSKKVLPKNTSRRGIILNYISGGQITFRWGNGVTVELLKGGILNSAKSGIVLDDGDPMYQEELYMIGDAAAVVAFHEIGGTNP